jgi:hypothetical protein
MNLHEPLLLIKVYPVQAVIFIILIAGSLGYGLVLLRQRNWVSGIIAILGGIFLTHPIGTSQLHAAAGGVFTACRSNLHNLDKAMSMYSTDWSGSYASDLGQLTPNYMKTLPTCPGAGHMSYKMQTGIDAPGNDAGFKQYYVINCSGENHAWASIPPDFPKCDSITGGSDRP